MKKLILFLLTLFLIAPSINAADKLADRALSKYYKSLQNKHFDGFACLDSLAEVFPQDYRFPYEKAILYVQNSNNDAAISVLDSLVKSGVHEEMLYQLLINCYMQTDRRKHAVETADSALVYFPNSSRIYCEYGYLDKGNNNEINAVVRWEYGVYSDPTYPENYLPLIENNYQLNDRIWSAIYGEIYLNISNQERNIEQVSAKIYDAMFSSLSVCDAPIENFRFCSTRFTYNPGEVDSAKYSFSFSAQLMMIHAYRTLCKDGEFSKSLKNLAKLWNKFDQAWSKSIYAKKWKNPVFDYHHELNENGLLEPYCYLMYRMGDENEFEAYARNNSDKLQKLAKFIMNNPIKLSEDYNISKINDY